MVLVTANGLFHLQAATINSFEIANDELSQRDAQRTADPTRTTKVVCQHKCVARFPVRKQIGILLGNLQCAFTVDPRCGRVHKTLGATPAMASGLVDRVLKMADCVAMIDAANVLGPRGPYKKREPVEISN